MSNSRKQVKQHPRENCYFCNNEGPLETHHIVPKRHGGSDKKENLVDVCANCHHKLEKLYDKSFYQRVNGVGVSNSKTPDRTKLEREKFGTVKTRHNLLDLVDELYVESCGGAIRHDLMWEAIHEDIVDDPDDFQKWLDSLQHRGEVEEREHNIYATTGERVV